MNEDLLTFAKIEGIELFRPGIHNGIEFSEADIDTMAASSNAYLDFVLESADKGSYEDNPALQRDLKPIPGLINLNHQQHLAETFKEASKGVRARFYTTIKNGVKTLCADLSNVRNDLAEFIRAKFPQRSIELIPSLFNRRTGTTYPLVIRSIGFLDTNMPPAVTGLASDLIVSFSRVLTFSCAAQDATPNKKEKKAMAEEIKDPKPTPTPEAPPQVSVAEFAALKAQLAQAEQGLEAERQARAAMEIKLFCEQALAQGVAPAAFPAGFVPFAMALSNNNVMEFAAGVKQTPRAWFLEYAKTNAPRIPAGTQPIESGKAETPVTPDQLRAAKIQEFAAIATQQANNPKDEREVYRIAYQKAVEKYPELF
jgi:hypothetical protein